MSVTTSFTLPQSIILKKLLEDDLWLKIEDPRGDQCDESSLKKERNYSWQTIILKLHMFWNVGKTT